MNFLCGAGEVRLQKEEGEKTLQPGQAAAAGQGAARGHRREQRRAAPGMRYQVPAAKGEVPNTLQLSTQ